MPVSKHAFLVKQALLNFQYRVCTILVLSAYGLHFVDARRSKRAIEFILLTPKPSPIESTVVVVMRTESDTTSVGKSF